MQSSDIIRHYDETMLSLSFDIDIEVNKLEINNTEERFTFNPGDKVSLYLQRNMGILIKETPETLSLTIINIGRDLDKKFTYFEWSKKEYGLPQNLGKNYCAYALLYLAGDLNKGIPRFHDDFAAHLVYLLKRLAISGDGTPLHYCFPNSQLEICLNQGVFEINDLNGNRLFATNNPIKLKASILSEAALKIMAA